MLQRFYDYFTLADYDRANEEASKTVVKRFTRGNISLKNAWYLTIKMVDDLSVKGDQAVARLLSKVSSPHS